MASPNYTNERASANLVNALEYGYEILNTAQKDSIMDFTSFLAYRDTQTMLAALLTSVNKLKNLIDNLHSSETVFDGYYAANNYIFTRMHTITGSKYISQMEGHRVNYPLEVDYDKAVSFLVPDVVAENYDIGIPVAPQQNRFNLTRVNTNNKHVMRRNAPLRKYYERSFGTVIPPQHVVSLRDDYVYICPYCLDCISIEEEDAFIVHLGKCIDVGIQHCPTCWSPEYDLTHRLSLEHHWRARRVVSYDGEKYSVTDIDHSDGIFMVNMGLFYFESEHYTFIPTFRQIIEFMVRDLDYIISSGHGIQLVYILQQIGFASENSASEPISCRQCNDSLSSFSLLIPSDFFNMSGKSFPCNECDDRHGCEITYSDFINHFQFVSKDNPITSLVIMEDMALSEKPTDETYGVLATNTIIHPFDCGKASHTRHKYIHNHKMRVTAAERCILLHQRQRVHRYKLLLHLHQTNRPSYFRHGVPLCNYDRLDYRDKLSNRNPYVWNKRKVTYWRCRRFVRQDRIELLDEYISWPRRSISGRTLRYKMYPGSKNLFLCLNRFFYHRQTSCAVFVAKRTRNLSKEIVSNACGDDCQMEWSDVEEIHETTTDSDD